MVVDTQQIAIFVTHVEVERQFLKIWAQTDEILYQSITSLLRSLQDKFDYYGPSASSTNLHIDARCVARAMNNEFHRVKVLKLRSDGMVSVQFLDYGMITFVPIHNIRTMENIPEARQLFSLPDAATPFYLDGVKPIGADWLDNSVTQIISILVNKRFLGLCLNHGNGIRTIKFSVMQEDFSQTLVNRNIAVYSSSFYSDILQLALPQPAQPLRTSHQIGSNQIQDNCRTSTACSQKVIKTRSFKAIQLEIGEVYEVKISHIEDGPNKFSVQLTDSLPHLESMMEKINSQPHEHLVEPPIAGTVCLGLQTNPIKRLCRVVLNSPGDTCCKVYYADYGHHETLPFDHIYQIPDEFVTENIFSIRFTLSDITDWKISKEMNEFFENLVLGKICSIKVCKGPMSPLTQYCELYFKNQSVKDILIRTYPDTCKLKYAEPKQIAIGSEEIIFVSFVESTRKFFVQLDKDYKYLDNVMEQIELYFETASSINPIEVQENMSCIALYEVDKKWYRASVISKIDQNRVRVFFVDYGNEEIVTINNIKKIPPQLVTLAQKQAIKCSLNGLQTNKELDKIFENLVLDKRLTIKVINHHSTTMFVELYEEQNVPGALPINIVQLLLPDRSAEIIQKSAQANPKNPKNDSKTQSPLGQKQQKLKNKSLNTRENWRNQPDKTNYNEAQSAKIRKDNENEHRLRNGPPESNILHSDQKRFNQNDHIDRNRGSPRNGFKEQSRTNSVLGSDISDKDSDTSSKSGSRRNVKIDQKDHDKSPKQHGGKNKSAETENRNQNLRQSPQKSARSNYTTAAQGSIGEATKHESNKKEIESCKSPEIIHISPPNITTGAIKNCVVIFYNSPSSFCVQLTPDNEDLQIITEKIKVIYERNNGKILPNYKIVPGLPCIALYSADQKWYRAIVKSIDASSATVDFVDYGNVETVKFSEIREIDPDLLKFPIQAIHCKLFCCKETYNQDESDLFFDQTDSKDLEAEFVKKENDIYHVLLREKETNSLSSEYINKMFAPEIDFIKERDTVRNQSRTSAVKSKLDSVKDTTILPDYASPSDKWIENKLNLGSKHKITVSWYNQPDNFYCTLASEEKKFREMMNEIQNEYVQRSPILNPKVGDSVIALLEADSVLYRAEIVELINEGSKNCVKVQYVDYGDTAKVDPTKIYPVEKKFMLLPRQAIHCGLKDIKPVSGKWSESIQEILQAATYCTFHEYSSAKYVVSLDKDNVDITKVLVEKNLALFSSNISDEKLSEKLAEVPRIDLNLLEGQIIDVKVSHVESVKKFYVQFHTAESSQAAIDSYMSTENSKMLKLPGQLSVMQNQAIECELCDVSPTAKANEILKKKAIDQIVKISIEKVDRNRLSVKLFNANGSKFIIENSNTLEKVRPVGTPLIFTSTHEVQSTWLNSSKSIWLQRTSDKLIEEQLLDSMYNHYASIKKDQNSTITKNELYAGLSSDGNFYRVEVLDIIGDRAKINLIDYGNVEMIPLSDIHALDSKFYVPYQLGIEVSLVVNLTGSNQEQINILEPFFLEKTYIATFYNVCGKWVVELTENGEKLSEKLAAMNIAIEPTKMKQFKLPELEEMSIGNKYNVKIAHVLHQNDIWLQRVEEISALNELRSNLQKYGLEQTDLEVKEEDIKKGSIYLAVNSLDRKWCRAEVLGIDEGLITVRFVDYGNMDAIEHGSKEIKLLPEEWHTIKKFAIPCELKIEPINEDANQEICERLQNLSKLGTPLTALIINDGLPMHVDLFENGHNESFCHKLVAEKLAVRADSIPEPQVTIEEEIQRDPNSTYVCCCGSVDEFWVQDDKWVNDLEMIEDRLIMANILPDVTEVKEGLICIALFPEDGNYYRATVLSNKENGTLVHYMDYGNTAVTNDLKKIDEDLTKIRPLAQKCRLVKPDGINEWPQDINEKFTKLSANGATTFIRETIEEGETCLVKLNYQGKDVADYLLKMCEKSPDTSNNTDTVEQNSSNCEEPEERPSPIGQENLLNIPCGVSYAKSLSDFWINKVSDYKNIDNIADLLEESEKFSEVSEIKVGKLIAAKYLSDNAWYRSKIISNDNSITKVLFVDYGNPGSIENKSDMRDLPENLAVIPFMAHHCSLKLQDKFEETSEIRDWFLGLIQNGSEEFDMKILDQKVDPMVVSLHLNGVDILDILEKEILELSGSKKLDDSGIHSDTRDPNLSKTFEVTPEKNLEAVSEVSALQRTPSPSKEEKIVPGSVSRGISVEDIPRFKQDLCTSSTAERICSSMNKNEPSNTIYNADVAREDTSQSTYINLQEPVCYGDKPKSGNESTGTTLAELQRPVTPKIDHSEKLVSGAVNPPKCNIDLVED